MGSDLSGGGGGSQEEKRRERSEARAAQGSGTKTKPPIKRSAQNDDDSEVGEKDESLIERKLFVPARPRLVAAG